MKLVELKLVSKLGICKECIYLSNDDYLKLRQDLNGAEIKDNNGDIVGVVVKNTIDDNEQLYHHFEEKQGDGLLKLEIEKNINIILSKLFDKASFYISGLNSTRELALSEEFEDLIREI